MRYNRPMHFGKTDCIINKFLSIALGRKFCNPVKPFAAGKMRFAPPALPSPRGKGPGINP